MDADADEAETSSESSDNSYLHWQKVTINRKRNLKKSPKIYKNKRPTFSNDDLPSTSNKFSILQNDDVDDDTQQHLNLHRYTVLM